MLEFHLQVLLFKSVEALVEALDLSCVLEFCNGVAIQLLKLVNMAKEPDTI